MTLERWGVPFSGMIVVLGLSGCSAAPTPAPTQEPTSPAPQSSAARPAQPPEPVVNHAAADAQAGERIEHGESILDVTEAKRRLNARHQGYAVLETRRVPGPILASAMTDVSHFALSKSDLDVINPGRASTCTSWRGSGTATGT